MKRSLRKNDESFGVVLILKGENPKVLLVQNPKGYWGFPKGHGEKNETPLEAAKREVFEETGVECEILPEPVFSADRVYKKYGRHTNKTTYFFLAFIDHEPKVTLQVAEIKDYKWATFDEAEKLIDTKLYPALKVCFAEIREYLKSKEI